MGKWTADIQHDEDLGIGVSQVQRELPSFTVRLRYWVNIE